MFYLCFGAAADLLSPYWNNSVSAELVHGMNVTGRIKTDLKNYPFSQEKKLLYYNMQSSLWNIYQWYIHI